MPCWRRHLQGGERFESLLWLQSERRMEIQLGAAVRERRPVDFYKPAFDVSGWKDLPVPSNWEVFGDGMPSYRNNGYIFQKDFPHVMSEPPANFTAYLERNPVGSYRR